MDADHTGLDYLIPNHDDMALVHGCLIAIALVLATIVSVLFFLRG